MSEVQGYAPRTVVPGSVVEPTAIVGPKDEALHDMANVVKELVVKSHAFHSEKDVEAALKSVDNWVNAHVPPTVLHTLRTEKPGRAPIEDVTKRVPAYAGLPQVAGSQLIDYNKLAAAIAAHMQAAQVSPANEGVNEPS